MSTILAFDLYLGDGDFRYEKNFHHREVCLLLNSPYLINYTFSDNLYPYYFYYKHYAFLGCLRQKLTIRRKI